MRMYHNKHRVSEKEFNRIQDMLRLDIKVGEIAKMTGWTPTAVSTWKRYKTWENYSVFLKTLAEKSKARRMKPVDATLMHDNLEHREGGADAGAYIPVNKQQDELLAVLMGIREQLKRLADAWEKTPNSNTDRSLINRFRIH